MSDVASNRKAICKAYYERNCDKLRVKSLDYYYSNKDKYKQRYEAVKGDVKKYNQEYRKNNREKLNQAQREYRLRKKAEKEATKMVTNS